MTCPPNIDPVFEIQLPVRKERAIARKRFTSEQIITMLHEAEVMVNQGSNVIEAARKLGITEQTYYRWRKEY